jgi:2,4-dienoyl-CoA reductase (NADPH2)
MPMTAYPHLLSPLDLGFATSVPRGAYTWVTRALRGSVSVPLVTSNRINTPEVAEQVLAEGRADMVSMARPFLADPDFVAKARAGRAQAINTCIGCNQACLDHTFSGKITSCLVNPRACHETELFRVQLAEREVDLRLGTRATARLLLTGGYDEIVVAAGVTPRAALIPGHDRPEVVGYLDVLRDRVPVGRRVAVIGAGGIGFDIAAYLTDAGDQAALRPEVFFERWGVDTGYGDRGALRPPRRPAPPRTVHLLQRRPGKVGAGLGRTTGWIHRSELTHRGVTMLSGVTYERIDDEGLHITLDGRTRVIPADTVVICAGQEPNRDLYEQLRAASAPVHVIGGADLATELDAKRAIRQGTELAAAL